MIFKQDGPGMCTTRRRRNDLRETRASLHMAEVVPAPPVPDARLLEKVLQRRRGRRLSTWPAQAEQAVSSRALTVYYDGACPVCAREIATYRRLDGAARVDWVDATRCDQEALGPDLDRGAAIARFHVRRSDGGLVHGAAAFAEVWKRLPAFAWLGRVAALPLLRHVLDVAYGAFLRVRRLWRLPVEPFPVWLLRDLRSNHAGETGAVAIYRGMLAVARAPDVRRFALRHLLTEQRHLTAMETVLKPRHRSWLLPVWRLAGWLTGVLPALSGPRAVYATIDAVETFFDRHYTTQLDRIDLVDQERADARLQEIRALLEDRRRDAAATRLSKSKDRALQVWTALSTEARRPPLPCQRGCEP